MDFDQKYYEDLDLEPELMTITIKSKAIEDYSIILTAPFIATDLTQYYWRLQEFAFLSLKDNTTEH